jgi:hypothetical protein
MSDRHQWAVDTAQRLREGDMDIDRVALAEELEQMGRSDARELRSRITQIMEHLLKLKLTSGPLREQNEHGWRASILRQQGEIETLLEESPSLHRLLEDLAGKCYHAAARAVAVEFDVIAPEACPFQLEDVLGKRLPGPGGV